jgi:hypothetical protein
VLKMPNSLQLVTVFDTNVYIGTSRDALHDIVDRESTAGVLGLASAWACLELLACCSSPDLGRRQRGHTALIKLATHVSHVDSNGPRFRLHEAGEFSLLRGLFGRNPNEPLLELGFVGNLAVEAVSMTLDEFRAAYATDLAAVAERVRLEEERFTTMLTAGIARLIDGAQQAEVTPLRLALIAAGLVQVLAEQNQVDLNRENSRRAVNLVVQNFPVALAFVHALLADASTAGGAPGRGNSAWDLKLAFHAAGGASLSGVPVVLVSDDGRLLRAAREANDPLRVMPISEYRSLLEDPDRVVQRSAALRR